MIIHIALFKWKNGTSKGQIVVALNNVQEMKNEINGIKDILVGENYHKESKGFTHGVVVIAKDQKVLDAYRKHPDHSIVAHTIEEIEEDGIGFDFKIWNKSFEHHPSPGANLLIKLKQWVRLVTRPMHR